MKTNIVKVASLRNGWPCRPKAKPLLFSGPAKFLMLALTLLFLLLAGRAQAAMVLEWKLDETNGSPTVVDSTGNGNTGTATNITFLPTGGILGGCAQFSSTAVIYMNTNGIFPPALKTAPNQYPIAVSVWTKNASANPSSGVYLFTLGCNLGSYYHTCRQTGYLDERNNLDYLIGNGAAKDTAWHNIVCIWESTSSQKLYVDGVLNASGSNPALTNQLNQFAIGGLYRFINTLPTGNFPGQMDDVSVWTDDLTAQQVAAMNGIGHFGSGTAGDMARFLAAFTAGTNITLNGIIWTPTNGLTGVLGATGGTVAGTNAYVILDDAGNGMQVIGAAVSPSVSTFVVSPSQVFAGDTATLTWNVAGADAVTIDQGIGPVALVDYSNIVTAASSNSSSITWTLVATNSYGSTTNFATLTILPTPGPLQLVANWPLDESSGTTATNSVGTNVVGQFVVAPNLIAPAWEPAGGYIAGDLFFTTVDTTNNVVVRSDLSGVTLTNFPFAMAAWVNTQDVTTRNETVISLCNSNSAAQYYCLQVDAGQARLCARNGTELDLYGGYVYGSGTYADWHYIVVDFERDTQRNIYVDGNLVATDANSDGGFFQPNRFSAGAIDRYSNPGISAPYTGHADEVSLFTGTLTPDDVHVFYGGMAGLGLNTAEVEALRAAFLQTNSLTVHGAVWVPVNNLGGTVGTTGGSIATQDAYLVMDTNYNGMQISTSIPGISGLSPSNPVIGSSGSQTLTILGFNFQSGCTVALSNLDTGAVSSPAVTFVSDTNLTVDFTFTTTPHRWSIQVVNPGSVASSVFNFTVQAPPQPKITSLQLVSGKVSLSGTNGTAGMSYSVLTSTNLALPLASWTAVATNVFGTNGSFGWTNAVNATKPQSFYIVKP